jgi:hypothetical protein
MTTTPIVWRELRALAPESFRCDFCGEQADTIHLVPWCDESCEHALFACAQHDPGGYWFEVARWLDPGERFRDHLAEKLDERSFDAERPGGLWLLLRRLETLTFPFVTDSALASEKRVIAEAQRLIAKIQAQEERGAPVHAAGSPDCPWTLANGGYPAEYAALAHALAVYSDEVDAAA